MVDRIAATIIFVLLLAMGSLQAQTANAAGSPDSTAKAVKASASPLDETLDLDDGSSLITTAKKPEVQVAPAVPAAPTPAPVSAKPAPAPDKIATVAATPSTVADTSRAKPAAVAAIAVPDKAAAVVKTTPIADTSTAKPTTAAVTAASDKSTAVVSKPISATDTAAAKPPVAVVPQAGKAAEAAVPAVKKAADEDLILEGGEDDLLDAGKIAQKKAAETKLSAPVTDSAHQGAAGTPVQAILPPGAAGTPPQATLPPGAAGPTKGVPTIPAPGSLKVPNPEAAAPVAELPVPGTIEKTRTLNFAKNLKEYRSPKLAMLMSLILPGSGQVYAQSNIWAAGFVVAEAALITTSLTLANTATQKKQAAHTYADQHYRADSMKAYMDSLHTYLRSKSITPETGDTVFSQYIFTDSQDIKFSQDAASKNDAYYSSINGGQSTPFIRGWDDVTPATFSATNGYQVPDNDPVYGIKSPVDSSYLLFLKKTDPKDSSTLLYGQSAHQTVYDGMIRTSLKFSNYSRTAFVSLIINHIASAVMAGILARKHNDELLGQESLWEHIGVDIQYVNTGAETVPLYALQVKF